MSELTPLNTDINREIDKDPFASDCPHRQPPPTFVSEQAMAG